jgi:FKBP-type peptidyl-prolyl cis-trans isomerase FklB
MSQILCVIDFKFSRKFCEPCKQADIQQARKSNIQDIRKNNPMHKYLPKYLLIFLSITPVFAQTGFAVELSTQNQKYSYAMGVKVGQLLKGQLSENLDSDAFSAAVEDVVNNRDLRLSNAEMQEAVSKNFEKKQAELKKLGEENKKKGAAFLAANAEKEGVVSLDNGLQYRVVEAGEGESPTLEQKVEVNYRGKLINGQEFDSSFSRGQPVQFDLKSVIPGFREAITRMKPGAKWEVFIPESLAYGAKGAGKAIGPNETLIFDIEFIKTVE